MNRPVGTFSTEVAAHGTDNVHKLDRPPRARPAEPVFVAIAGDDPLRELSARADASVDLLYCGGIIHRMARPQAAELVAACLRVLKPLGSLRVATIDLDRLLHGYLFDWNDGVPGTSRTCRLNAALRHDGLAFLYGEEELTALLAQAGCAEITRFAAGASSHPRFWHLESGGADALVLEARRP